MTSAYLDHAASTPLRPEAVASLVECLEQFPGNPSGQHRWARDARRRLDDARDVIAEVIGFGPGDIVFTSGGTEGDNLAIVGTSEATGGSVVCAAAEHHAVLDPVRHVGGTVVGVDAQAHMDLSALDAALAADPATTVVSAMLANNEVGALQPLAPIAEVLDRHRSGADRQLLLHSDCVAGAAWVDVAAETGEADLITISGHKVGAPKGIGVLAVRRGTPLAAIVHGGGQERERRSGTQNVAGAVALAAAMAATAADRAHRVARVRAQRDRLVAGIVAACDGARPTLAPTAGALDETCLVNLAHLSFRDLDSESLLFLLDHHRVAASAGSSCASGALEPSHVVSAMGVDDAWRSGTIRFSLGWNTSDEEIDHALAVVPRCVAQLRGTSERVEASR